jgi:hypothetical protein
MQKTLLFVFLFCTLNTVAQRGFLMVQKNGKTIKTYTTGSYITLNQLNGRPITGLLAHVKNDTFSVYNYNIVRRGDYMGAVWFDTIYRGYQFFRPDEVKSIFIKKNKSILQTIEGASYLLGVIFTATNIVNGIRIKDNFGNIAKNVAIKGGGFFVLSTLLSFTHKEYYVFNKKLKLKLMPY